MSPREEEALHEAVAALYFYGTERPQQRHITALWSVVRTLDPAIARVLEEDPKHAFDLTFRRADPKAKSDHDPDDDPPTPLMLNPIFEWAQSLVPAEATCPFCHATEGQYMSSRRIITCFKCSLAYREAGSK